MQVLCRTIRVPPMALGESVAALSHGTPNFFIRDKVGFVNYMENRHDDGRLARWCACAPGDARLPR